MSGARVTGVQSAQAAAGALLAAWRDQFGPREYAVLLDLVSRAVDAELRRNEPAQKRCAA